MEKTCSKGHKFIKTSDCLVCPVCAKSEDYPDWQAGLAAPARRALKAAGIDSLDQLSDWSRPELLRLHGLGPASLPQLVEALARRGLRLKSD